jgi:hypothetical protein
MSSTPEGQSMESNMRTLNLMRAVALGVAAAITLSVAAPALAKTHPYGGAGGGGSLYNPGDTRCYTDEGYGRRSSCDGGAG